MDVLVENAGAGAHRLVLVGGMQPASRLPRAVISGFESRAEAEHARELLLPHVAAVEDWLGYAELGGVLTAVARCYPEVFGATPPANGWDRGIRGVARPFGIGREE